MAKRWMDMMDMVDAAKNKVTGVTPAQAYRILQNDQDALLIELPDAEFVRERENAPDVVMISLDTLPMRADLEISHTLRDPRLEDRSRRIITT